jgi:endonuclease G, mitochondrial
MRYLKFLINLYILLVLSSCVSSFKNNKKVCFIDSASLSRYENKDLQYLNKKYFSILYSNNHVQPHAVVYSLSYSRDKHSKKRGEDFSNHFSVDQDARLSATKESYYLSGYDRGHIAPSGDFNFSIDAARSTFIYSNISPQNPAFNRTGSWKRLETAIRNFSENRNLQIQVIAGPILNNNMKRLKGSQIGPSIPDEFYKIIIFKEDNECKGAVFKLENNSNSSSFENKTIQLNTLKKDGKVAITDLLEHIKFDLGFKFPNSNTSNIDFTEKDTDESTEEVKKK